MRNMDTPKPAVQRMCQYDYKIFLFHGLSPTGGKSNANYQDGNSGELMTVTTSPLPVNRCN